MNVVSVFGFCKQWSKGHLIWRNEKFTIVKMEAKEDGEEYEEQALSPIQVLQELSEEAFKLAGETLSNVYSGNSSMPPLAPGHRRSQSEVVTTRHRRSNSFHKLKSHMQKAWKWGSNSRDDLRLAFNPEVLANQKRQWYELHSKSKVFYSNFFHFSRFIMLLLHFNVIQ